MVEDEADQMPAKEKVSASLFGDIAASEIDPTLFVIRYWFFKTSK
jgi:hypothetical protein